MFALRTGSGPAALGVSADGKPGVHGVPKVPVPGWLASSSVDAAFMLLEFL
jgi:hypothetical protein